MYDTLAHFTLGLLAAFMTLLFLIESYPKLYAKQQRNYFLSNRMLSVLLFMFIVISAFIALTGFSFITYCFLIILVGLDFLRRLLWVNKGNGEC